MTTDAQQNTNKTFRFLIVDDSRAIQSIIRRSLGSCGYPDLDIRVAGDGEVALSILSDFKPDLIITDWHMPKMSGLEFSQQVRQLFGNLIPIGFITTESGKENLEKARLIGASFIIIKPFLDNEFTSKILSTVPLTLEQTHTLQDKDQSKIIIDPFVCKAKLSKYLPNHSFKLDPCKPIALTDLTNDNLIGLYGREGKPHPVVAVAVMNMHTVGMLWGVNKQKDKTEISNAIASQMNTDEYIQIARSYMEDIGPEFNASSRQEPISLTRSGIFNRTFQRLEIVLKTNAGRVDFRLEIPGIGEGLVAFILL